MAASARSLLVFLGIVFTFFYVAGTSVPEGMQKEVYCLGCETTMKVFDRLLRGVHQDKLHGTLSMAFESLCMASNFDLHEVSKDLLSSACNHLIKQYGPTLKEILLTEYHQQNLPTYLNLVQRVCSGLTGACHGVLHDDHDHDPLTDNAHIKLDTASNEFVVLPGKNLKMAKPISEMHEEL